MGPIEGPILLAETPSIEVHNPYSIRLGLDGLCCANPAIQTMSTASDKPAGADSARQYKAHYELWDEVSPAFEPKPAVPSIVHFESASPRRRARFFARALIAVPVVILAIIVWRALRITSPPANLTVSNPPVIEEAPPAAPTPVAEAAVSQPQAALPPPAPPRAESPATPAAIASPAAAEAISSAPSAEPATKPSPAEASENESGEAAELSPEKREMLEASIRSELTHLGFPKLGVSVAKNGDVFLSGTLLDRADETRVIATVRAYDDVSDIYFSGALWHESETHPEVVTMPTPAQTSPSTTARANSN